MTVIGFDAHPVEGSFNVISPETTFRLSLRTAPNQRPEEAQEALARFMVEHAPFGAEVWVDKLDNGMGWAMDPNAEATKDAMDAMEEAFGVAPVNKGEGGSIPFIPELQRHFRTRRYWSPVRRIRRPTRTARTNPSVFPA